MITHRHHIVPKHAGGSDDPSNLVNLTVPEHAEAHRLLYEQYGRKEDYLAWRGLSGLIDIDELKIQAWTAGAAKATRERVKNGTHHFCNGEIQRKSALTRAKNKLLPAQVAAANGTLNLFGGEIQSRTNAKRVANGSHNLLGSKGNNDRLAAGTHPSQQLKTCEFCGKVSSVGMYTRWHGINCKQRIK